MLDDAAPYHSRVRIAVKHQCRVRLALPAEDKSPLGCAVSSAAARDAAIF
jgi:hypothetical protein